MAFYQIKKSDQVLEGECSEASLKVGEKRYSFVIVRHLAQVYVLDDRCPHAGASLSAGFLSQGHLACPLHAWEFDLKTGECRHFPQCTVPTYFVREEAGLIEVEL